MCRRIYRGLIARIIILFFSFPAFSQYKVEELMKLKPQTILKYENLVKANSVIFPMDFNSPVILNLKEAELLKDKTVLQVELYYTDFQIAESFSQPVLNKERYEALEKLCPDIFKQKSVTWKIIGQVGSKTVPEAKKYFHGFVVTYSPAPEKETVETKDISKFLHNDSLGHDTLIVSLHYKYRKVKKRTGFYLPILKSKRDKGIHYAHKGIWNRPREYNTRIDTLVFKTAHKEFIRSKDALSFMKRMPDSTIFKVLDRHEQWKNILFVCDVTGSMSPYTSEILVWHKLNYNSNKARYFTFFNDGDDMPDRKKRIGRTGGVYCIAAENYESVETLLYTAMNKGDGGDSPENNCEAVIKSLQQMSDAQEIVMIADNSANIKDLVLAENIKKPVRIILCGAEAGFINADYLELARKTNGSVHIMNEDLENLVNLNEGETFTFGKATFKIVKGKIVSIPFERSVSVAR